MSISNKAIFSEPVFNSSAAFDYLWEELTIPVPYDDDWQRAEQILREEAERASSSADARRAMEEVRRSLLPGFPAGTTRATASAAPVRAR